MIETCGFSQNSAIRSSEFHKVHRAMTAFPSPPREQNDSRALWISHAFSPRGLIFPALLIVSGMVVFRWDVWISLHCHKLAAGEPEWLRNILDNVEPFGHAVGAIIAALLVFLLDVKQRKVGLSVFCAGVGGGMASNFFKLWIGRIRPRNFDFSSLESHATLSGWWPIFHGGSGSQSFPSAHAATAFGLAVMLSSVYPRGRGLFFLLAVMVLGHRLHSGAHFASDILFGAALGWLVALICVRFAVRHEYLHGIPTEPEAFEELRRAA